MSVLFVSGNIYEAVWICAAVLTFQKYKTIVSNQKTKYNYLDFAFDKQQILNNVDDFYDGDNNSLDKKILDFCVGQKGKKDKYSKYNYLSKVGVYRRLTIPSEFDNYLEMPVFDFNINDYHVRLKSKNFEINLGSLIEWVKFEYPKILNLEILEKIKEYNCSGIVYLDFCSKCNSAMLSWKNNCSTCDPVIQNSNKSILGTSNDTAIQENNKPNKPSNLKQLHDIYSKFISLHNNGSKYISLNSFEHSFTKEDIRVINLNKDLFYFFSFNRVLLVINILDLIGNLFKEKAGNIFFLEAYEYIRDNFSLRNTNRSNLKKLFRCEDVITYLQFENAQDRVNNAIESLGELPEKNLIKLKTGYNSSQRLEKLKEHVKNLLGLNCNSSLSETELDENDNVVLNKVIKAIEATDIELCRICFQFPEEVKPIIDGLKDFSQPYILYQERLITLSKALKEIHISNNRAKVNILVKAFTNDEHSIETLNSALLKCEYVCDLKLLLNGSIQDDLIYKEVYKFLVWLKVDLKQIAKESLHRIFKNERQIRIVKGRSIGETLDMVGQQVGLTRERIRQIEKKVQGDFLVFCSRFRPQFIVLAFSNSDILFSNKNIIKVFKENSTIFSYFLKKLEDQTLIWSEELDAFIAGNNKWYVDVIEEMDNLPSQINLNDIRSIIKDIKKRLNIIIEDIIIKKIITSRYKQIGNYYSKSRFSKKEMYKIVFEKYYQGGMKLFDDFETMRFKAHLKDVFPDLTFDDDDTRVISERIKSFTILYDRGKYILPSKVQIEKELLDQIHAFIFHNERSTVMFAEIFEKFKLQLLKHSNIHNRYFLQGILKCYFSNDFTFYRDCICLDAAEERNIKRYIEEFIKGERCPVSFKEIKEKFVGVTDIVISNTFVDNENILQWGFAEYIHSSMIEIDEKDQIRLKRLLDEYLRVKCLVHVKELYERIFLTDSALLNRITINNHMSLFSIYQYLYSDDYAFKRPYISLFGTEIIPKDVIIRQYLESVDRFNISELKQYLEDKKIRIMDFSALIDKECIDFLRIDKEQLIRIGNLNITNDNIANIEDSIIAALGEKGYLAAKKFDSLLFLPYLGVKWSPYMLVSFIKKFCARLKIFQHSVDYRFLKEIILNSNLSINNYEELINYALEIENKKIAFKRVTEIEEFLKEECLIANAIPKSFIKKYNIKINEFDSEKIT